MTILRQIAVVCFFSGALILALQVIFRTTGEQLASFELTRSDNSQQFETKTLQWPQELGRAEILLVVDRKIAFEQRRPYQSPLIHIIDAQAKTVYKGGAKELQSKGRLGGRIIVFTAGTVDLDGAHTYQAITTIADDLAAPENAVVSLELRKIRTPSLLFTFGGFGFIIVGVVGLFLTRPK